MVMSRWFIVSGVLWLEKRWSPFQTWLGCISQELEVNRRAFGSGWGLDLRPGSGSDQQLFSPFPHPLVFLSSNSDVKQVGGVLNSQSPPNLVVSHLTNKPLIKSSCSRVLTPFFREHLELTVRSEIFGLLCAAVQVPVRHTGGYWGNWEVLPP